MTPRRVGLASRWDDFNCLHPFLFSVPCTHLGIARSEEEEEEFEEEVEGGARVLSRTVAGDEERASGEYDQDGYPDEGESY